MDISELVRRTILLGGRTSATASVRLPARRHVRLSCRAGSHNRWLIVSHALPARRRHVLHHQATGGSLRVGSISTFPFPPGGTVIQDVKSGNAQCIHETIVPFPGGFSAPFFCIPGLGFTVKVTQTGCGIGQIASNGGADYTVTEVATAATPTGRATCRTRTAHAVRRQPAHRRTVGDGTPDSCARARRTPSSRFP